MGLFSIVGFRLMLSSCRVRRDAFSAMERMICAGRSTAGISQARRVNSSVWGIIAARMLLNSCAIPLTSVPRDSIFWCWRKCCSSSFHSVMSNTQPCTASVPCSRIGPAQCRAVRSLPPRVLSRTSSAVRGRSSRHDSEPASIIVWDGHEKVRHLLAREFFRRAVQHLAEPIIHEQDLSPQLCVDPDQGLLKQVPVLGLRLTKGMGPSLPRFFRVLR